MNASEQIEMNELRAIVRRMREVIPYVTATLGTSIHLGFVPERIRGFANPLDTIDWGVVHRGRARSSYVQLQNLEIKAKELETKLQKTI